MSSQCPLVAFTQPPRARARLLAKTDDSATLDVIYTYDELGRRTSTTAMTSATARPA